MRRLKIMNYIRQTSLRWFISIFRRS